MLSSILLLLFWLGTVAMHSSIPLRSYFLSCTNFTSPACTLTNDNTWRPTNRKLFQKAFQNYTGFNNLAGIEKKSLNFVKMSFRAQWLICLFLVLCAQWFSGPGEKKKNLFPNRFCQILGCGGRFPPFVQWNLCQANDWVGKAVQWLHPWSSSWPTLWLSIVKIGCSKLSFTMLTHAK